MQKKVNLSIKNREGFRPFAPSVMAEEVQNYFEMEDPSPYNVIGKGGETGAGDFLCRTIILPATGRINSTISAASFRRQHMLTIRRGLQTVDSQTHPRFWQLLWSFRELTGCAVLLNTSFNVRDEPIVNTPDDAFRCFLQTKMDYLVIGDFILTRRIILQKIKYTNIPIRWIF